MEPDLLKLKERSVIYPCSASSHWAFWDRLIQQGEPIDMTAFDFMCEPRESGHQASDYWEIAMDVMTRSKAIIVLINEPHEWPNIRSVAEIGMAFGQNIPVFVACPFIDGGNGLSFLGMWATHPSVLTSNGIPNILKMCRELNKLRLSS